MFRVATAVFGGVILLASGCAEDQRVAQAQKSFVVSAAPDGIRSIKSTKRAFAAGEVEQNSDVVLVGRVYAGPDGSPWETGRAAFTLTCSKDGNDSDHDPYSCPFCRKKITEHLAFVQFEEDGDVIAVSAQELLGLSEKQKVVIKGTAELNARGELMVSASQLFKPSDDWTMPESEEPAQDHTDPSTDEESPPTADAETGGSDAE